MKLRDHPKLHGRWPPYFRGTHLPGAKSPVTEDDVLVSVELFPPKTLLLQTQFRGDTHFRQLFVTSCEFARKLCGHLGENVGHTVGEIGAADVDF